MKRTILRVMYFAVLATVICIGCGDDGVQNKNLEAGELLSVITGGGKSYTLTVNAGEGGSVSRNPNNTSYKTGERVTVTATAADGYMFTGWSGASNDTTATVTVTMSDNLTLTARFVPIDAPTYTLTVNLEPSIGGNVSREPNRTVYSAGEEVAVTATTMDGYAFTGWSGDANGANTTVTVIMNSDLTVNANFQQHTYSLSTGANTTQGGTVSREPYKAVYTYGERVTVTATPAKGYIFKGWADDAAPANPSVTVAIDGDKTLTAIFEQQTYKLTTNASPSGYGSVSRNPSKDVYTYGEQVTVTATAAPASGGNNYTFNGWTGALESTSAGVTITMDGDKTLTAKFERQTVITYTLTTITKPDIGTISRNPNNASYKEGEAVTVTAPTVNGYTFTGWSGDATSTTNPVTVIMVKNTTLTANYIQQNYTLTVDIYPTNGGTVSRNPNNNTYTPNQTVTVTATPAGGYKFTEWSGAATGTSTNATVIMTGNKSLTAVFEQITYSLETGVSPSGGGFVLYSPNKDAYNYNDQVTVTAAAADCHTFKGWSGAATGTTNPVTITMNGNKTLTANFSQQGPYTFTTSVSPSGGGTVSRSPNQTNYACGATVAVTATPAGGYEFTGWSGAASGTANPMTITMDGNKELTANFQQITYSYTLTTGANPSGGGTVSRSPNQTSYTSGTSVSVTATPNTGYTFTGWSGATSGTANPVTITMDGNKELIANFQQITYSYSLTTGANPSGGGTVSRSPNQTSYTSGSSVTITATPNTGYTFTGWSGAASGTTNPVTITMDGNKELTANFQQITYSYTLTTGANPSGGGTVSRSPNQASYTSGTSVAVTATPNTGYTFIGWSGAASGTANPVTITMDGNKELIANFQQITYAVTVSSAGTGASGSGSYVAGATVTISAGTAPAGPRFKNWTTTSSGVTFANANSATTSFTMPANAVTVTAVFEVVIQYGTFTDSRNSKTYRTVVIGGKRWMAENLNYQTGNSWCYDDNTSNCNTYGRLYDWNTARTACPSGWHLSTRDEWDHLAESVGGTKVSYYGTQHNWLDAGTKLKSTSGWYSGGNGTDEFGFSALPGGIRHPGGNFYYAGYYGYWWTATEYSSDHAYYRYMSYDYDYVDEDYDVKSGGRSVRCVQD